MTTAEPLRFLIVLILSFGLASAQDFPELTGRVVDAAGILSPQTEASLTQKLAAWEEQSSDQIVVVTVADLQGVPIERYGVELGRTWGIGVADGDDGRSLDNGALLIVAPNDRALRIEVGYGLEGTLTDALSNVIIRERIVPSFRSGDFETGVTQGVDGMLTVLKGEEAEWLDRRRRAGERPVAESEGQFPWPLIIFIVIFVLPPIFRSRRGIIYDSDRKRRRRYGGSGDALAWMIASELAKGASRGGGGWSSGGGGFGGGFSGGGGSFGGGGASGSW